ncbi:MAG: hypothetical protein IJU47_03095 [Verrucomicrobia bacterium]|nr:hypothetical protein [Verrucomicrobiota bacterium]
MSRLGAVHIAAKIVEQKRDALWIAELINGHRVIAFFCSELKKDPIELRIGEWVILEVSPFDLSEGSILSKLN